MRKLGIELISVYALPPVPFVELAGSLGCSSVSMVLEPLAYNPERYPHYSLRSDPALRSEVRKALAGSGVEIGLGEGFIVRAPGAPADLFVPGDDDMRERWARDLEIMADLGVPIVNAVCLDDDFSRGIDQLGLFADLAGANAMVATIEFCPGFGAIRDLPAALRAATLVGDNLRLLIDPMHLIRSGGVVADLAAIDPKLIAYAQLCDVPIEPPHGDYLEEAMNERVAPGAGELPLVDFVAALPEDVTVSLEVPQKSLAEAGQGPGHRMGPVVAAARRVLAQAAAC